MEKENSCKEDFFNSFEENNYSLASKFAREKKNILLFDFLDNRYDELADKLDTIEKVLNHFASSITSKKELDLFEIGQLQGYVQCLSSLLFEESMDNRAMRIFESATEEYSAETLEEINRFIILLSLGPKTQKELDEKVNLSLDIIDKLEEKRIICTLRIDPSNIYLYSLADDGLRIVGKLINP